MIFISTTQAPGMERSISLPMFATKHVEAPGIERSLSAGQLGSSPLKLKIPQIVRRMINSLN